MQQQPQPRERPVKKPRACPFRSDVTHTVLCTQEECMIYSRLIKQCALVDLAITMHEVEKYLMQLLGSRLTTS